MDQQFDHEQSFGNEPQSATDVHYRPYQNHQITKNTSYSNHDTVFHALSLEQQNDNQNYFRQSCSHRNMSSNNQFSLLQQNRKLAMILLTIKMDTIVSILHEKTLNRKMHGFLRVKNYETRIQTNCLDLQYCIQNVSLFAQKIDSIIYQLKLKCIHKCWINLLKSGNAAKFNETIPNLSNYTTTKTNQNDPTFIMNNQIIYQSPNQINQSKQKKRITSRYSQSRGIGSPNGIANSGHVSPNAKHLNQNQKKNQQMKKKHSNKERDIEEQQVRKQNRVLKNKKNKMKNNVSEFYQQMDELLSIHQHHLKK